MPRAIGFGRLGASSGVSRTTRLPTNGNFTMMAWVQFNSLGNFQAAMHMATGIPYYMGCSNGGLLELYNGAGVFGSALTVGRWYHMAMTVAATSGPNWFGYLNGVLDATHTANAIAITAVRWGTDGTNFFRGQASAFKVYNRVLSAGEIAAEMDYAMPVSWVGLNSCYSMPTAWEEADMGIPPVKPSIGRWADYSGNNLDLTTIAGTVDEALGPPIKWAPTKRPIFFRPLRLANAGGGTSVLPGAGSLVATGFAPAIVVSNNQNVLSGVGVATLTGFAPTVAAPRAVTIDVGVLTLTGFAPTIGNPAGITAGVGAVVLSGFSPLVSIGTTIATGTGLLTAIGFAPTVLAPRNLQAGVGAALLTGFAPTVFASNNIRLTPGVGQLVLSGFSATTLVASGPVTITVVGEVRVITPVVRVRVLSTTPNARSRTS